MSTTTIMNTMTMIMTAGREVLPRGTISQHFRR